MKVTEHIAKSKSTLFTIELLPPLKGQTIESIFSTMDELMDFSPAFVDVTYHREEFVFRDAGNGLLKKQVVRKRPGTVGICAAISNRYKVDTVPHIICGGFNRQDTEDALIDLNFLGVDNILVLRGDPIKSEGKFNPEPDGHSFAVDLVKQAVHMNDGKYLDDELKDTTQTNFCIGVAGYPEKHFESPNRNFDLRNLKAKVDAGASYIVTQMFYDNQAYFKFVDECRACGIQVPIIPGLKPIATKMQLNVIPHHFHINLPDDLVRSVERARNDKEVRQIGIEWCIHQSKELMKSGVPILHYYTMGKAQSIKEVAASVF